jgi:hypothetical protein
VTAERLQIPDPTDPALVGGRFTFTIQLTIGDFIVATEQQGEMGLSGFSAAGGYIELDHILYEGVAQSGESLIVQALAAPLKPKKRSRIG